MKVFPQWLLPAVVLLLVLPGSCRKESGSAKAFSSSEDEYLAALELLNEKQKNIYFLISAFRSVSFLRTRVTSHTIRTGNTTQTPRGTKMFIRCIVTVF